MQSSTIFIDNTENYYNLHVHELSAASELESGQYAFVVVKPNCISYAVAVHLDAVRPVTQNTAQIILFICKWVDVAIYERIQRYLPVVTAFLAWDLQHYEHLDFIGSRFLQHHVEISGDAEIHSFTIPFNQGATLLPPVDIDDFITKL
ncbi:hypothetical protein Tco_1347292 [Tanacetum coccineum]